MAKNNIIQVICFGNEIGRLGFDENKNKSYFQYHSSFLEDERYSNLFPETGIIKRISPTQVFSKFNVESYRGLPPMIADSLPDLFGNIIFKKWLESNNRSFNQISVLEQLAYVANRGMGALEYKPIKKIPTKTTIDVQEIVEVLQKVILNKEESHSEGVNSESLLNIFKIGTSAGGARPKILISEHINTQRIIPGDINFSKDYHHYLVKLSIEESLGYNPEAVEYSYYLTAKHLGIEMMPSKLIEDRHFATLRFDRQGGKKKHILTASGLTGWDFKNPEVSSYENLFDLALFLKLPQVEIEELFKRMIFNITFCNTDDHLKNHSFIYNEDRNSWNLSPAYDLTYSLNPLMNYKRSIRALSINEKRVDLNRRDVLKIAEEYTIKNPQKVIKEVQEAIEFWLETAVKMKIPNSIIKSIKNDFYRLP